VDGTLASAPVYNLTSGTALVAGETMTHTATTTALATTADEQIKTGAATTFQGVAYDPTTGTTEGQA